MGSGADIVVLDMTGIYYKPDYGFGGVRGDAAPFIVDKSADDLCPTVRFPGVSCNTRLDPYLLFIYPYLSQNDLSALR